MECFCDSDPAKRAHKEFIFSELFVESNFIFESLTMVNPARVLDAGTEPNALPFLMATDSG